MQLCTLHTTPVWEQFREVGLSWLFPTWGWGMTAKKIWRGALVAKLRGRRIAKSSAPHHWMPFLDEGLLGWSLYPQLGACDLGTVVGHVNHDVFPNF